MDEEGDLLEACMKTAYDAHEVLSGFGSRLLQEVNRALKESQSFYGVFKKEDLDHYISVVASYTAPIVTSPLFAWFVTAFRLCFIPFVAYRMEDKPEQIFLLVYSFIMLKRDDTVSYEGDTMRLWRLLLPSLLLARQALPSLPIEGDFDSTERRPWRVLSLTLHIIVILTEIHEATSGTTDPALETFVVGAFSVYVMSLSVWTGLSVVGLLLLAFLSHLYVYSLANLEPQFLYAGAFYLESAFLSFDKGSDSSGSERGSRGSRSKKSRQKRADLERPR